MRVERELRGGNLVSESEVVVGGENFSESEAVGGGEFGSCIMARGGLLLLLLVSESILVQVKENDRNLEGTKRYITFSGKELSFSGEELGASSGTTAYGKTVNLDFNHKI